MIAGEKLAEARTSTMLVRIACRKELAHGIISLELRATDDAALPSFEAGAHIDVFVRPDLVRQYSLCNDPADNTHYRLAVLLEANSRGASREIHRAFVEGQTICISQPKNNFPLDETARHSWLFAGGIGITPLLPMARRLDRIGRDFSLHYCVRNPARAAFLDEISASAIARRTYLHFDDGPADQRLDVDLVLRSPDSADHIYVCGPQGFMDYVISRAREAGWPEERIHLEYFNAGIETGGEAFTVVAARSDKSVEVPSNKSIAQALKEVGIESLLSCEQGVCGTCLTEVLEGTPDHRDLVQTEQEKAQNRLIAVCCSRSKSKKLILNI
jgi:vanillate O-demethylase ferredoxin subunit